MDWRSAQVGRDSSLNERGMDVSAGKCLAQGPAQCSSGDSLGGLREGAASSHASASRGGSKRGARLMAPSAPFLEVPPACLAPRI